MGIQRILAVEDSALHRRILRGALEDTYEIVEAENGEVALHILEDSGMVFDAVILDVVMPVMDGYGFMEAIESRPEFSSLPILVTTKSGDLENSELRMLEMGACDFVSKPYNETILKLRVRNAIERNEYTTLRSLQYLAEYDAVTGIYNKGKFFQVTRKLLDTNPKGHFSFVRFDIDRFQLINSFFGADEGDRLLKLIANCLTAMSNMFEHYTFGRIEADIFCFCIETKEALIDGVIQGLQDKIASFNENYNIVMSFGVYSDTDHNCSINDIFDRATLASRQCKGSYTNRSAVYDDSLRSNLVFEQEVVNDMNGAIIGEQFEIYFQPIVDLETEQPVHAEVLVRWPHPQKGFIAPNDFIPVCERNGLIADLDRYVWEAACKAMRKWLNMGVVPLPLTVNCSRVNAHNIYICDVLKELLDRYALPASLLQFEITETAYMDDPMTMTAAVVNLQKAGFRVLMDDFGSGYSSLNILKDIAFDTLKLDMGFLEASENTSKGEVIFSSIVDMVKRLEIPVVAEGVETELQVRFLKRIGCDFAQGYYYYRPLPMAEFEKSVLNI